MNKELIVANNPKSSVSEAIKAVRTNLMFSSVDKDVKSILVTSSNPSEGKSFTAANLAIAFAQTGANVLIVDCDMRKGRQHKMFKVSNKYGLSVLLLDDISNYEDYIQETGLENVSVLTCGIVPPNPSELLGSDKNKDLLELLEKEYDIVIYDGTPVGGLTDSVIMAELVDKIIIVSAYKQTPIDDLMETKKCLEKFSSKIAGVVLNKMPRTKEYYYR